MVRVLRWTALVALLVIPVVGYLGRRTPTNHCVGTVGSCDILYTSPAWAKPVEVVALGTAVLLFIIAAAVKRSVDDDSGSINVAVLKAVLYMMAAATLIAGITWGIVMPQDTAWNEFGPAIAVDDTGKRFFVVILSAAFAALIGAIAWALRRPEGRDTREG
jgi:hypothetical protein